MFDDVRMMAEQVGWPIAIMMALIVLGDRMGILSIKRATKEDDRLDKLIVVVTELGLKVARVEAILEERRK